LQRTSIVRKVAFGTWLFAKFFWKKKTKKHMQTMHRSLGSSYMTLIFQKKVKRSNESKNKLFVNHRIYPVNLKNGDGV
jgi:hypothetical protein